MDLTKKTTLRDIGYLPADESDHRRLTYTKIHTAYLADPKLAFDQLKAEYRRFGDMRILLEARMRFLKEGLRLPPLLVSFMEERIEEGECWSVFGESGVSWQVLFEFVTGRWPSGGKGDEEERYMLRLSTMINLVPEELREDASSIVAYHRWMTTKTFHESCIWNDHILVFSCEMELAGRKRRCNVRMKGCDGTLFVVKPCEPRDRRRVGSVYVHMSTAFFEKLCDRYFGKEHISLDEHVIKFY